MGRLRRRSRSGEFRLFLSDTGGGGLRGRCRGGGAGLVRFGFTTAEANTTDLRRGELSSSLGALADRLRFLFRASGDFLL